MPDWVHTATLSVRPTTTTRLGPGESAVLQLAMELEETAYLLLMDDKAGRREAKKLGFPVIRTIALLEKAASRELIHFEDAFGRLLTTSFYLSQADILKLRKRN